MNEPAPEFFPAAPADILAATFDRVTAVTGYANVWLQRALPQQDGDAPFALIWHGGDTSEPMGDANVGIPSFDHVLRVVVVIVVTADTAYDLNAPIVAMTEKVRAALLTDPSWLATFEACTKADIQYAFPGDGQLPYARGMIAFDVSYRSDWPPVGGDDLTEIAVTAGAGPDTFFHQSFPLGYAS